MTDEGDGWYRHVRDRVERLPPEYFREFVVDIWGLRGFDIGVYEGEGAEFVGFRGPRDDPETEVVALTGSEGFGALVDAAEGFDGARPVAVAKRFGDERTDEVERVDADRLARLVAEGGFYWTFYRWVALSEADEADVLGDCEAPVRFNDGEGIVLGRATADRLGADDGDVVRIASDAAGRATKAGLLDRYREYVEVGETYRDAIEAEDGDDVLVERLEAGEARRVYVLSVPAMDEELASEVWQGHAPHAGAELSQPYGGDEIRTMALEVLPHDHCYVGEATDVVVEGYTGARRVFD
jgi:hypothetical protein